MFGHALPVRASAVMGPFGRIQCVLTISIEVVRSIRRTARAEATAAFLGTIYGSFLPNKFVASVSDGTQLDAAAEIIPLLKGKRSLGGKTTVYVCQNFSCKEPVTNVSDLERQLGIA